jgi:UDP-N-acetylmuramoyl-tripeptide--D-alanyl-D-alanine ligase
LGKGELFAYLTENKGVAFVNTLDAKLPGLAATVPHRITYPQPADAYPTTLLGASPNLHLRLASGTEVAAQLTGDYNFPNLAAAAAVGGYFGVPTPQVAAALAAYNPQNNRSQLVQTTRGNDLILDAYNANPSSMAAALRSFAQRPTAAGQGRVAILGDMFELGETSAAEHRQLGELLATLNLDKVLLIGPLMADAAAAYPPAQHFADKIVAGEWLAQQDIAGQLVLLKGSRGMGLEALVPLL